MEITVSIPDNLVANIQTEVDTINKVGSVQNEPKYIPITVNDYILNILVMHAQILNSNQIDVLVAKGTEAIKNLPDDVRSQVISKVFDILGIVK